MHPAVAFLVAHPNVAVVVLGLGGLLICMEFHRPGRVVPGMLGLFCVLLACWSVMRWPVWWPAAALLLLSTGLAVVAGRLKLPLVAQILGVCGIVLALRLLLLSPMTVPWWLACVVGLGFGVPAAALAAIGEDARQAKFKLGTGW